MDFDDSSLVFRDGVSAFIRSGGKCTCKEFEFLSIILGASFREHHLAGYRSISNRIHSVASAFRYRHIEIRSGHEGRQEEVQGLQKNNRYRVCYF